VPNALRSCRPANIHKARLGIVTQNELTAYAFARDEGPQYACWEAHAAPVHRHCPDLGSIAPIPSKELLGQDV